MIWLPVCAFGGFASFAKDHSFTDTVDLLSYSKNCIFTKRSVQFWEQSFIVFSPWVNYNSDQLVTSFLGYSLLLGRLGSQKFFNHSLTRSRTKDVQDIFVYISSGEK